ncbi:MAG: hypothetical protein ABR573_06240 [Candidatus Dormibacteria bacterium]
MGARNAVATVPLALLLGALLLPRGTTAIVGASAASATSPTPSASPCVAPGTPICPSPSPSTSSTPTRSPTTRASPTPTARTTARPTATPVASPGGGSGQPGATPSPAATPQDSSGNLVGKAPGPPPPPAIPGSRVDILADPQAPGPGDHTTLTITVSGSRGTDRYAVPAAHVDVELSEKPDDQASLSATSLTTDGTGSAATTLTLSKTKGRHVVTATSGGISGRVVFDTLAGSTASTGRARHSAGTLATRQPPINPVILFVAAALFVLGGFLFPYRTKLSFGRRPRPARRSAARDG